MCAIRCLFGQIRCLLLRLRKSATNQMRPGLAPSDIKTAYNLTGLTADGISGGTPLDAHGSDAGCV